MTCPIRLRISYILLSLYYVVISQQSELSVEIDGLEYNDQENIDNGGIKQMKLMGLDYYDGTVAESREEYDYRILLDGRDSERDEKKPNIVILDTMDTRNYRAEMKAGNKADLLGTNPHYYQPVHYPNFSRRFVLQYPYTEKGKEKTEKIKPDELKPMLASPELVLAVAENSALLDVSAPKTHNDEIIRKDILRTGNYWNSVWKEDADPKVLRSHHHGKKLETIKAEIPPGTKLYNLVSKLKHLSPTLLYVLNDKK